jgi:hypothetical protein
MIQKIYPTSEPQFMCSICSEAVTNPLCPFCLSTEIEAWLTLYPDLRSFLLHKIKKYLTGIENKLLDATNCIKCNKRASVCPYCFTEYVLRELKNAGATTLVLKEFFEFFNFDFDHSGYYEEAEKMGVY